MSIRSIFLCIFLLLSHISFNWGLQNQKETGLVSSPLKPEKWDPDLFRVLSFGHSQVGVDALLIRFLAHTSYEKKSQASRSFAFYDLDLATDVDPAFFELYWGGANMLSVVLDDKEGARDLVLKGNQFRKNKLPSYSLRFKELFWSGEWQIPLLLAYVYLFEFDDLKNAAQAFQDAADLSGGPAYLQSLKARLQKRGGVYDVGLRLLQFMIQTAPHEKAKENLEKKRFYLFVNQTLFQLNHEFLVFLEGLLEYNRSASISGEKMNVYWKKFMRQSSFTIQDPWGGSFYLDKSGKIETTTPHEKVLGLT